MDDDYEPEAERTTCFQNAFRSFVCVALSVLLGIQIYAYFSNPGAVDGDFSDVKHVIMQLTNALTEVKHKHERLQTELQQMSETLPVAAAAATRAKEALGPSLRRGAKHDLDLHDIDKQVADFALESAGARVIDTAGTVDHVFYEGRVSQLLHLVVSWMCRECLGARAMLRPGALPGECWAFQGAQGEATIQLLGYVRVTGLSLEHIPPQIAPTREIPSAPRLFQLEGLEYRNDPRPHDFGTFEFNRDGKPIQYFEASNPNEKAFSLVRFRVFSNWGHPEFTCVYRLRVHGELAVKVARPTGLGDDGDMRVDNE